MASARSDETFELLTLTQTGKGAPVPIVLLDTPGDPYWETVHEFVGRQLVERGLVSQADTGLYLVTEDRRAERIAGQRAREQQQRARDRGQLLGRGRLREQRVRREPARRQAAGRPDRR